MSRQFAGRLNRHLTSAQVAHESNLATLQAAQTSAEVSCSAFLSFDLLFFGQPQNIDPRHDESSFHSATESAVWTTLHRSLSVLMS